MLKCDLHLHSQLSPDCNMSLDTIVRTCLRRGIDCIALTDHNSFSAVRRLQSLAPFHVIPGEEIKTTEGEIIGLFLTDEIPRGKSPGATVEEIRRQGGVVYVPHPFDRIRRSVLRREALMEILDQVDVIETYNSRISFHQDVEKAMSFAREHGKLQGAGSDSHVWWELGNSYVEMPDFEGRDGFLRSLAQGTIHGKLTTPLAHVASSFTKIRKKYLKRSSGSPL
ncbi:MAG: PHP-associated domain-containing protein [Sphingomonadaceae bacterium]